MAIKISTIVILVTIFTIVAVFVHESQSINPGAVSQAMAKSEARLKSVIKRGELLLKARQNAPKHKKSTKQEESKKIDVWLQHSHWHNHPAIVEVAKHECLERKPKCKTNQICVYEPLAATGQSTKCKKKDGIKPRGYQVHFAEYEA